MWERGSGPTVRSRTAQPSRSAIATPVTSSSEAVIARTKSWRASRAQALRLRHFPEAAIDEFSRSDSTVEFYTRVNALLERGMIVVDYGAGRGQWMHLDESATRRSLQNFRARGMTVIGVDIDEAVLSNPSLNEAHVLAADGRIPVADATVDLIVSDWTFEHIDNPELTCAEFLRVLRPGGWVCARTPNKWGYIGVFARLIPNRRHVRMLTRLQPRRQDVDVFPVRYRLNTRRGVAGAFGRPQWDTAITYTLVAEPAYAGGSRVLWSFFRALGRLGPRSTDPILAIFCRKGS